MASGHVVARKVRMMTCEDVAVVCRYMMALGVVFVALLLLGRAIDANLEAYDRVVPVVECAEDMACWDCETMGNTVCGPTP